MLFEVVERKPIEKYIKIEWHIEQKEMLMELLQHLQKISISQNEILVNYDDIVQVLAH